MSGPNVTLIDHNTCRLARKGLFVKETLLWSCFRRLNIHLHATILPDCSGSNKTQPSCQEITLQHSFYHQKLTTNQNFWLNWKRNSDCVLRVLSYKKGTCPLWKGFKAFLSWKLMVLVFVLRFLHKIALVNEIEIGCLIFSWLSRPHSGYSIGNNCNK